jgi:SPP1 family predicted phage head-tail adaptor
LTVNPQRFFEREEKAKQSMSYSSGFRNKRVTIRNKVVATTFGDTTTWKDVATVWAARTWKTGAKAMREGALDVYDKVLFRMNWNDKVTRDSLLVCDGKTYHVLSMDGEKRRNEIEILAQEVVQEPPSYSPLMSNINGGSTRTQEFGG